MSEPDDADARWVACRECDAIPGAPCHVLGIPDLPRPNLHFERRRHYENLDKVAKSLCHLFTVIDETTYPYSVEMERAMQPLLSMHNTDIDTVRLLVGIWKVPKMGDSEAVRAWLEAG